MCSYNGYCISSANYIMFNSYGYHTLPFVNLWVDRSKSGIDSNTWKSLKEVNVVTVCWPSISTSPLLPFADIPTCQSHVIFNVGVGSCIPWKLAYMAKYLRLSLTAGQLAMLTLSIILSFLEVWLVGFFMSIGLSMPYRRAFQSKICLNKVVEFGIDNLFWRIHIGAFQKR